MSSVIFQPVVRPLTSPAASARLTAAVVVAGVCTFLQVYATQPLLPAFRSIFHASALQVSLTISAVTAAVAIASPLVGLLADVLGRKRIIVPSILLLALPTMLCATSTTLNQIIVWRFLQGLCVPGIIAVTIAYIAEEAPTGTAGRVTAAYVAGTVLGGLVGRLLTAVCADTIGWRAAFVILGSVTFLGGLLVWRWLPASRHFRRASQPLHTLIAMTQHLRNPRLLATYFVGFNALFSLVGAFTYVNFHLAGKPYELSTTTLGFVFLVYALGVFVTPMSGPLIDRFGHRHALVLATMIVCFGAAITLIPTLATVILGLAVLSTGIFICQAAASAHVALAAEHTRSAATGLYVCLYYLGGSAGATVLGLAWNFGHWPACIALIVLVQLLAAAVAYRYFSSEPPTGTPSIPPPIEIGRGELTPPSYLPNPPDVTMILSMMRISYCVLLALVMMNCHTPCASAEEPQARIIFDTDMETDCDDAAALGVLHALADNGECDILATVSCALNPTTAPTLDAINTYYGRPDIPIGNVKTSGVNKPSRYTDKIAARCPHDLKSGDDAPDALDVYRKVLAAQPDHSVTLVTVGYLTNVANLLRSPGGTELVAAKVKLWVCMGGNFIGDPAKDDGKLGNHNFEFDAPAAMYAIQHWPASSRIVFVGREVASVPSGVKVGKCLSQLPADNPVRMAYEFYFGGKAQDRHVADPATVLCAVRGPRNYWDTRNGRMTLHENMTFEWTDDPAGPQTYLLKKKIDGRPNDRQIEQTLEQLLLQPTKQANR